MEFFYTTMREKLTFFPYCSENMWNFTFIKVEWMQISFWKKGKMHHKTRSEWKLSSLSRILHSFLQKKLEYRVTHSQVYILRSLLQFHNINLFFRLCYKFAKEFRLLPHSWKFCPLSKQQCLEHKVCYISYLL